MVSARSFKKCWPFTMGSGDMFRKRDGMSFTQRTQRSQRGAADHALARSTAPLPSGFVQVSALPRSTGRYSLIPPLRPLRETASFLVLRYFEWVPQGVSSDTEISPPSPWSRGGSEGEGEELRGMSVMGSASQSHANQLQVSALSSVAVLFGLSAVPSVV